MIGNADALTKSIFEHMEMYWSNVTKDVIDVQYTGWLEIIVTTTDGQRFVFNESESSIRRLPDPQTMTKEQCLFEFGCRLRNIMYCRSMGQEDLARATGIQQARISDYIRGKTAPGFYNLDKIARALNCPVEDLRVI